MKREICEVVNITSEMSADEKAKKMEMKLAKLICKDLQQKNRGFKFIY